TPCEIGVDNRQISEDGLGMDGQACGPPVEPSEDTEDKRPKTGSPMLGPDRYVSRLAQIPHAELEARGFRGLIVDLDNTMLGFAQTDVEEDHLNWVREAKNRGFKLVMVSNNFTTRVT